MAPNLPRWKHDLSRGMIRAGAGTSALTEALACSRTSISLHRSNLAKYGNTTAPRKPPGRRRSLTPCMCDALREYVRIWPDRYLDEFADYLFDDFDVLVSESTISRELKRMNVSKKQCRQIAQQRDPELRDLYLHNIAPFDSEHLVFVDESGCDPRHGFRRRGWSPLGVTPNQIACFQRSQRYHILPAYTQDGILFSRVYKGSTDTAVFENFIEHLLPRLGRWPEPRSVLIMDNASFHHSVDVKKMCQNAGVKLIYLPAYSPDLNPIEEFFADLKARIKREWVAYNGISDQDFCAFLEWCVEIAGNDGENAKAHFRHAGYIAQECSMTIG